MKRFLFLLMALIVTGISFAEKRIEISPAEIQASPGEVVYAPVVLTGFGTDTTSLLAIEFYIEFDNNVLTYTSIENLNPLFSEIDWLFSDSTVTNNNARLAANWVEPTFQNNLMIPDGTVLFELMFVYSSGESELDFDEDASVFSHLNPDFTTTEFYPEHVNGLILELPEENVTNWNGTGYWSDASFWDNGLPTSLSTATIQSGECTIQAGLVSSKLLTIDANATLIILPNKGLTVDSLLTNNGLIHAISNETGTGSLIVNNLVEGATGNYQIERYLNDETAHTVGAPLAGTNVDLFSGATVSEWDEPTATFNQLTAGEALESGKGYLVQVPAANTYTFESANVHQGDVQLNLSNSYSGDVELQGLNLITNPYPSAIEWNDDWSLNNTGKAIYVWQGTKYLVWNGYIGNIENGIIPAMQGFVIKAYDNGASVTMPNSARLHSSQPYYKEISQSENLLMIEFGEPEGGEPGPVQDVVYYHVNSDATEGFDPMHDAYKIQNADGSTMAYSILNNDDDQKMAIDVRGFIDESLPSVPLGFRPASAGTYYLRLGGLDSFDETLPVTLQDIDPDQQNDVDMRQAINNTYIFSAEPGDPEYRFILHFSAVGIDEVAREAGIETTMAGNILTIVNSQKDNRPVSVDIYDVMGRSLIRQQHFTENTFELDVSHLKGLFIVKIATESGTWTGKFFR